MNSCLYLGTVRHRRFSPRVHDFGYRLFWTFLDLDHLEETFAGSWFASLRRPAPARYRRGDYLGDPNQDLSEAVRDLVERETGERPAGAIRLLTHLRYLGLCFNPVSIYYCHDGQGKLAAIVAQITNTPWNQRHAYVLEVSKCELRDGLMHWGFAKDFHVSPFFGMDQTYRWSFSDPAERLHVHMENLEAGRRVFDATLSLARKPWTRHALDLMLLRFPSMTFSVLTSIYWQAFRLWIKRIPFHPHPASPQT